MNNTMLIETIVPKTDTFVVGMGERQVSRSPAAILACIGIGSCIAVCAYDVVTRVGGMAHIVLPAWDGNEKSNPGKFADTGVPLLIEEMTKLGGSKSRLVLKLAGGAQMSLAPGITNAFKTGERNLTEVVAALERLKAPRVVAAETGGHKGRTVRLYLCSGKVTVKNAGGQEQEI